MILIELTKVARPRILVQYQVSYIVPRGKLTSSAVTGGMFSW